MFNSDTLLVTSLIKDKPYLSILLDLRVLWEPSEKTWAPLGENNAYFYFEAKIKI